MASTVPNNKNGGRKKGHKFKSLLVWQYLLKNTDENHAVASKDIIDYLDAYGMKLIDIPLVETFKSFKRCLIGITMLT